MKHLPTDIHLVEYEVEGTLYVDSVRAYKKVDIFDAYYDKLTVGGTLLSITNGSAESNPNCLISLPNLPPLPRSDWSVRL